ncbi:ferric reductase-like transmembrane domain-containing protein [Croceicoccus sp. Ery5]|uniref:ferric reductase-like transmembrane domain-containing protein n=1 Tax=Croceicoccus sp. Ery5 TaxID=1703340 RepID=UPI001E3B5055|nr:ferric reductase-like transmembrane domain-containing protein [Croceicoccus sp. Ery5]
MRGKRLLLWAVLALPAALMAYDLQSGRVLAMDLLHPSGELSVRLMVAAMLPGPLAEFFGLNRFFRAWLAIRRNLGVAAFLYGLLHLVIYVIDMRMLSAIVDELTLPAIWTGWLALALMSVPAAISFNAAMRALKRRWKQVQMFVYPAFALALVHWLLLDWAWQPAFIHLAPPIAAWLLRLIARIRKTPMDKTPMERSAA